MSKAVHVLAGLLIVLTATASPAAGQTSETVSIAIEPAQVETSLGQSFDIQVTVSNPTEAPTVPLVAHIDITDPDRAGSVDPEDWTSTLTKDIGVIPPGESRTVTWQLQPISPGTYRIYAVGLSSSAPSVAVSHATTVSVASTRTLDPEGVLPVVIAGPVLVGGLLVLVLRRSAGPRPAKGA
jgi:hypothetical protein